MRVLAFLILSLFFAARAGAAESVIFMLNMNYSSKELEALKEVGKNRGQAVVMVPPESLIPQAERMFAARDAMEKKVKSLRPDWSDSQVRTLIGDYMRKGLASDKDPAVNSALGQEVEDLHRQAMALSEEENRLGPIEQQVRDKLTELKRQGKRFDSLVFSAHSDGSNLSGETSNRLSSSGITRLAREFPAFFQEPRHVLLLGCYNMTETNHFRWRYDLFTNASLIAGFGVRAPSRHRPVSAQFVRDVMNTADRLDGELIAKGPLEKGYVEKVFKNLSAITNTQSVLDYCLQIIEGQPNARSLSCEEQWNSFRAIAETVHTEYLDLRYMSKDPPHEDTGTFLREFYNTLQSTCPARSASQIPRDQVEAAERYRTSVRETLIRLIYWWNVQKNFKTYFSRETEQLARELQRAGIREPLPSLDGTTGRVEFVKRYNAIESSIRARHDDIQRRRYQLSGTSSYGERNRLDSEERSLKDLEQLFRYYYPLYALEGEDTVGDTEKSGAESTLARGGIPFHWIESGAVLEPRGGR